MSSPKESNKPTSLCRFFLGLVIEGGNVKLDEDGTPVLQHGHIKGCNHHLDGRKAAVVNGRVYHECRFSHAPCFFHLMKGNQIGNKILSGCSKGSSCNRTHDFCRDCAFATQTLIPKHSAKECPHQGTWNKILIAKDLKPIEEVSSPVRTISFDKDDGDEAKVDDSKPFWTNHKKAQIVLGSHKYVVVKLADKESSGAS